MRPFVMDRPPDISVAVLSGAQAGRYDAAIEWLAGGTDLLQLLREDVRQPSRLVDLSDALGRWIEPGPDGLRIAAGATMAQVAAHALVRERFPLVVQALLASASPQVRNMATIGGNLLQRTRCAYFRDRDIAACNKRSPGSGCAALHGDHRTHAVLGVSAHCIATHASDLAVALVALGATVRTARRPEGRLIPLEDFYRLPDTTPEVETALEPGELVAAVDVPTRPTGWRSHYLKLRDRASFEWPLVSVAAGLEIDGDRLREVRLALGGVGTVPWRLRRVEAALEGQPLEPDAIRRAALHAVDGAHPRPGNAFKLELMPRAIVRAVTVAGGLA
jgi:xanthine dehydrogenase YagS FAD-binding subunit